MQRFHRALTILSAVYVGVSVLMVAANVFWVAPRQFEGAGCMRDDALLVFVRCQGFTAEGLAGGLLSLPWSQGQMLYGAVTGLMDIWREPVFSVLLIAIALLLWSPVIYLAWRVSQRCRIRDA